MLHPVGRLPARVYWRRRLVFVGLPLLGIILILWALLSSGGGRSPARNTSSTTTKPASTLVSSTSPAPLDSGSIGVSTTAPATTPSAKASASAPGKGFCAAADLTVTAGTAKKSYAVKARPVVYMQVTDVAATPCKLDVADKSLEWRIYSGDVRFWGSNDCAVKPGTHVVTLIPQRSVRLSITWSGLTSLPKCAGTRMFVQAGTYKLYAYLIGRRSPAATFTIK
jgi:hypothetical protein